MGRVVCELLKPTRRPAHEFVILCTSPFLQVAKVPGNVANAYQTAYAPFERSAAPLAQPAAARQSGGAQPSGQYSAPAAAAAAGGGYPAAGTVAVAAPYVAAPGARPVADAFPQAVPGGKDLWNSRPNATHGGFAPIPAQAGPSNLAYEPAWALAEGAPQQGGGYAPPQAPQQKPAQSADVIGNGSSRAGSEWTRPKYHIPGYSGFIRGVGFRFGDTFAKTTRMALDIPTDLPLEP